MNHKINHLKNISQKSKKFFQFLSFVLKKIIPLQMLNGSSVLLSNSCLWNLRSFKRYNKSEYEYRRNAGLLICYIWYFLEPQRRMVSPLLKFQTRCYFVFKKFLTQTTFGQQIASNT